MAANSVFYSLLSSNFSTSLPLSFTIVEDNARVPSEHLLLRKRQACRWQSAPSVAFDNPPKMLSCPSFPRRSITPPRTTMIDAAVADATPRAPMRDASLEGSESTSTTGEDLADQKEAWEGCSWHALFEPKQEDQRRSPDSSWQNNGPPSTRGMNHSNMASLGRRTGFGDMMLCGDNGKLPRKPKTPEAKAA